MMYLTQERRGWLHSDPWRRKRTLTYRADNPRYFRRCAHVLGSPLGATAKIFGAVILEHGILLFCKKKNKKPRAGLNSVFFSGLKMVRPDFVLKQHMDFVTENKGENSNCCFGTVIDFFSFSLIQITMCYDKKNPWWELNFLDLDFWLHLRVVWLAVHEDGVQRTGIASESRKEWIVLSQQSHLSWKQWAPFQLLVLPKLCSWTKLLALTAQWLFCRNQTQVKAPNQKQKGSMLEALHCWMGNLSSHFSW